MSLAPAAAPFLFFESGRLVGRTHGRWPPSGEGIWSLRAPSPYRFTGLGLAHAISLDVSSRSLPRSMPGEIS